MVQLSANLSTDRILSFCQNFILQHPDPWPPDEKTLANEFVSYFESFNFLIISELEKYCTATGIELTKKTLPRDLLAVNCFPDGKRIVVLGDHAEYTLIQPHTVLHEIRELLEYSLRDLGSPTTDKDQIESRADEFASLVMIGNGERICTKLLEDALGIESGLWKFLAVALIGFCAISVCAHAHLSATYPYRQDQWTENHPGQRYLT
jgi:hypothetical protein